MHMADCRRTSHIHIHRHLRPSLFLPTYHVANRGLQLLLCGPRGFGEREIEDRALRRPSLLQRFILSLMFV